MNSPTRPPRPGDISAAHPSARFFAPYPKPPETHVPIRPRRSVLYMPASSLRALEKARELAADALIFDLEDAVAPEQKQAARETLAAAVAAGGYGKRELVIRINALHTQWAEADLRLVAALVPAAVLLPKISTPGDIMKAARALREAGGAETIRLWAMMETPLAILNADAIARTAGDPTSRLSMFVMGTNDLARETRARLTPGRAGMVPWLATCVAAARAHNVDILDGVFGNIADAEGLRAECEQARDMGFDGKTLIHPSQLEICNEVFAPSAEEIAWSRRVIAAFADPVNAGKGALSLDGKMVERLHADIAQRTLDIAGALADAAN